VRRPRVYMNLATLKALVHKLRSQWVKVIVIGVAQTLSRLLREAADTVHCYPVPVQEKEPMVGAALDQAA
jgi:hypothetical protein